MSLAKFVVECRKIFEDNENYSDEQVIAYGRLLRNMLKMRGKDLSSMLPKDISISKLDVTINTYIYSKTVELLNLHFGLKDGIYHSYYEICQEYNIPVRVIIHKVRCAQQKLNNLMNLFSKYYSEKYGEDDIKLLNLSSNSYLALLRAGIRTVTELCKYDEKELLKIKFIGKVRSKEIMHKKERFLEQIGD